jgi:hypothetical protein
VGLSCSQCLLINRGSQQPGTLILAVVGVGLLYAGLRFLLTRLERGQAGPAAPAILRFLGGVLAGLVIFLA